MVGDLKGLFKLRIGDYRAIYFVKEQRNIVYLIGHRRDVYKR
ncbi:MAG: type II toxin-antitoxin system RelE/ParE family toxin [Dehalococcoidia bacterium]